jgi:hypothetical protein
MLIQMECGVRKLLNGNYRLLTYRRWFHEVIFKHPTRANPYGREWSLVIIDSFGGHTKLANDKYFIQKLLKYRTELILVPKSMTPILQPLDVTVNRSFQQYYGDRYDEWLESAIDDPSMHTKSGNLKVI